MTHFQCLWPTFEFIFVSRLCRNAAGIYSTQSQEEATVTKPNWKPNLQVSVDRIKRWEIHINAYTNLSLRRRVGVALELIIHSKRKKKMVSPQNIQRESVRSLGVYVHWSRFFVGV